MFNTWLTNHVFWNGQVMHGGWQQYKYSPYIYMCVYTYIYSVDRVTVVFSDASFGLVMVQVFCKWCVFIVQFCVLYIGSRRWVCCYVIILLLFRPSSSCGVKWERMTFYSSRVPLCLQNIHPTSRVQLHVQYYKSSQRALMHQSELYMLNSVNLNVEFRKFQIIQSLHSIWSVPVYPCSELVHHCACFRCEVLAPSGSMPPAGWPQHNKIFFQVSFADDNFTRTSVDQLTLFKWLMSVHFTHRYNEPSYV